MAMIFGSIALASFLHVFVQTAGLLQAVPAPMPPPPTARSAGGSWHARGGPPPWPLQCSREALGARQAGPKDLLALSSSYLASSSRLRRSLFLRK